MQLNGDGMYVVAGAKCSKGRQNEMFTGLAQQAKVFKTL